nr:FRG domain-containing protein [Eubacteriales bacterium]
MKSFNKLYDLAGKIENELDFDFRAQTQYINSIEEFEKSIINPFKNNENVFFRGERVRSIDRPLMPSIYRSRDVILDDDEPFAVIDSKRLKEIYYRFPEYINLYEKTIGEISTDNMYPFLSFSQHYFGLSPLIDLTKNPFVALSFALKNRDVYTKDILIYSVEIKQKEDYTCDLSVANKWINDYSVILFRDPKNTDFDSAFENRKDLLINYKELFEEVKGRSLFDLNAPSARLIDVPVNDLMRFQQGVFLLLDDFTVFGNGYLTKKIRDDFAIKKWIVNKDICPSLLDYQRQNAPQYDYASITDLSSVVGKIKNIYF